MIDPKNSMPGLKRATQGEWQTFDPARLYLDDIGEVFDLFRKVSPSATLRLDEYELGSPSDAAQLRSSETRDLRINSGNPYASFETQGRDFTFYVSDRDDLVLRGLREATKGVVRKRRLWVPKSMVPYYLLLLPSWSLWIVPKGPFSLLISVVSLIAAAIFLGVVTVGYRNQMRRQGKVILRDSGSKRSFRKENRDLLLVLLTSVLTFVATVVAGVVLYQLGFVGSKPP